jgi:hypothetical protein
MNIKASGFSLEHVDSIRTLHGTICEEISTGRLKLDEEGWFRQRLEGCFVSYIVASVGNGLEEVLTSCFKLLGMIKNAHIIADTGNYCSFSFSVGCVIGCFHPQRSR